MSDPNKPPAPETDGIPHIVEDAPRGKMLVNVGPNLPVVQTVSLGSGRLNIQKVISADTSSPNKPTDIPKMTETDAVGTPLELERTLEELRSAFGGGSVIETDVTIPGEEGAINIKIEFGPYGALIWQTSKKSGKKKCFTNSLQFDSPACEVVINNFTWLGIIRAILRHRLVQLSKNEE